MSLLDPRLWLAFLVTIALSLATGYVKGKRDERSETERKQLKAIAKVRDDELELQRLNNRWTGAYVGRMTKQQEKARALPTISIAHDCAVPAAAGSVLNDAQRLPDDAGPGSGARPAGQAIDSTCTAELNICKRNYAEVCVPNAEQLTELQQRWRVMQQRINGR
ncbi:MAG TPA: hypothetical protein VEC06_08595 [Paucimonas sp.]|nr:hypothetical protein [Paucimonas sp.]